MKDSSEKDARAAKPAKPALPPAWWARLLTLLLPIALCLVGPLVSIPGVAVEPFSQRPGDSGPFGPVSSVLALGLTPILTAYVLVEIAALLVPAWRPLRLSPEGRSRLARAAAGLSMVLALFQAYGVMSYLQAMMLLDRALLPAMLAVLSMVAGTALLLLAARHVDARGAGNGIGVLLAMSLVTGLLGAENAAATHAPGSLSELLQNLAIALLAMAVVVIATVAVLRRPLGPGVAAEKQAVSGGPMLLRAPLSGILPLLIFPSVVGLLAQLASWRIPGTQVSMLTLDFLRSTPGTALQVVVLGAALSFAFQPPGAIGELWSRNPGPSKARGEGETPALPKELEVVAGSAKTATSDDGAPLVDRAYAPAKVLSESEPEAPRPASEAAPEPRELQEQARSLLGKAAIPTLIYLAVLSWATFTLAEAGSRRSAVGVALVTAVVVDVVSDLRYRKKHRDAAVAWATTRPYAADRLLAALRHKGIDAFARNMAVRTLLRFFAPFAVIEILVPESELAQARKIAARLLA